MPKITLVVLKFFNNEIFKDPYIDKHACHKEYRHYHCHLCFLDHLTQRNDPPKVTVLDTAAVASQVVGFLSEILSAAPHSAAYVPKRDGPASLSDYHSGLVSAPASQGKGRS